MPRLILGSVDSGIVDNKSDISYGIYEAWVVCISLKVTTIRSSWTHIEQRNKEPYGLLFLIALVTFFMLLDPRGKILK